MANLVRRIDEMSCLAKECVHTGGDDNSLDFTLLACGTRVYSITRAFGHRQGLTSECWLHKNTSKSQNSDARVFWSNKFTKGDRLQFAITWSILRGSPSRRRASAGMMSPSLTLMMSPGTRMADSTSLHRPSLRTFIMTNKNQYFSEPRTERQ